MLKCTKGIEGNKEAMSYDSVPQMFQAVLDYARDALKAAMLVNGGGAVALLAFIGKIWSEKGALGAVSPLACSLTLFGFGVFVAALSTAFTYFTQYSYLSAEEYHKNNPSRSRRWAISARILHVTALALVLVSFALFGCGVYSSGQVLGNHMSLAQALGF